MESNEIQNQIAEEVLGWLRSTEGFVAEQAPDICSQILNYNMIVCVFWTIITALIIAWIIKQFKNLNRIKEIEDMDYDDRKKAKYPKFAFFSGDVIGIDATVAISVSLLIIGIFTFIGLVCAAENIVQILVAPKVYLIEYFANLASGGC